ncbi:hypothetical protein NQ176_g7275 [Zarea fungicola]|uniref:Uncharacterized protein n=1 Tax=Zarea fungicola TaxID=93591 RepID=A0ACC1MZN9_9HYPO|nr:hypothetical protein NQ176_g7275 [Lecanicillium fungicola]
MAANVGSPPFDPELTPALAISPFPKPLTDEHIPKIREFAESISGFNESDYPTVTHEEYRFPGPEKNELIISLFRPKDLPVSSPAPCIYFMHGGGFYHGTRFNGAALPIEWAKLFGGIVVSVEYRAAPENRAPALQTRPPWV